MDLTLDQAVDYHKKLWHGIAAYITEHGRSFTGIRAMKNIVRNSLFPELYKEQVLDGCFLCEFAKHQAPQDERYCDFCPMVQKAGTECLNGLHANFWNALQDKDIGKAVKLAEEIADLPVINPRYID